VEGDDEIGQAELRVREHAHRIRQPRQGHFDGNGDLLLDFLGGPAGVERNDRDLDIRNVGEGFDRQILEGNGAAADQQDRAQYDEERFEQREADDAAQHYLITFILMICCSNSAPSETTLSPGLSPSFTRMLPKPASVATTGWR